jgi:hypothetical protein
MARDRRTDRLAGLQQGLRGLFRKLEKRPLPDHLRAVVDQLDAADPPVKKAETA